MKKHSKTKALKPGKTLIIALALACFALRPAPNAFGVVPAPDGGYPGFNTGEGQKALFGLTTGVGNTAVGWYSLFSNTDGSFNTGVGAGTLLFNVGDQSTGEGVNNTALGTVALLFNTTGSENTGVGTQALFSNTTGLKNVATGYQALASNTTGNQNTANGREALFSNTVGGGNTGTGDRALRFNTTGNINTAVGTNALQNATGFGNTALGAGAGQNLTSGNNNIDIGNSGVAGDSDTTRIGFFQTRTFISGIRGVATGSADTLPVLIDVNGQLGTVGSSRRFKKEIRPMDKASEALLALKPVTFQFKSDKKDTPQFGLIAEEVAEVNPDLVVRDDTGEIYTVRYDAVNAMLLNEFLKEHRRVEELKSKAAEQEVTIAELKSTVAQQHKGMEVLTAQLKEQAAQIQKVSAQIEVSKPVPRMAVRNP